MKPIKWKTLVITTIFCLLPILFGVILWDKLPDVIAIHFGFNGEPDNFTTKSNAVFGLPIMMALLQIVCCTVTDVNSFRYGESKKFELVSKLIIPFVSIALYVLTLGYALGWNVDIRKFAMLVVGILFFVIGRYLPEVKYIKHYNIDPEKAQKINRFTGTGFVVLGILMLVSIALPPVASVVCLLLLIPYTVINFVYAIKVLRNK